jgi:hypothetical protein
MELEFQFDLFLDSLSLSMKADRRFSLHDREVVAN